MHNAVVSKLIAASRGSPCDSMASCYMMPRADRSTQGTNHSDHKIEIQYYPVTGTVTVTVTECYVIRSDYLLETQNELYLTLNT